MLCKSAVMTMVDQFSLMIMEGITSGCGGLMSELPLHEQHELSEDIRSASRLVAQDVISRSDSYGISFETGRVDRPKLWLTLSVNIACAVQHCLKRFAKNHGYLQRVA